MPYSSKAQQRLFHAKEARGEISHATVAEFDAATDFKGLPEHVRQGAKNGQSTPELKRHALLTQMKRGRA